MGSFIIEIESGSLPDGAAILRARDPLEAIEILESILKESDREESICLDARTGRGAVHGHPVDFTPSEARLMVAMLAEPGRVFEFREMHLIARRDGWTRDSSTMRTLVRRLRYKLDPIPGIAIVSDYGKGFKLDLTE